MAGVVGMKPGVKMNYTPAKLKGPGATVTADERKALAVEWGSRVMILLTFNPGGYQHNQLARAVGCSYDALHGVLDRLEQSGNLIQVDEENRYQLYGRG